MSRASRSGRAGRVAVWPCKRYKVSVVSLDHQHADPPELPTLRFCWTVRCEVSSALGSSMDNSDTEAGATCVCTCACLHACIRRRQWLALPGCGVVVLCDAVDAFLVALVLDGTCHIRLLHI